MSGRAQRSEAQRVAPVRGGPPPPLALAGAVAGALAAGAFAAYQAYDALAVALAAALLGAGVLLARRVGGDEGELAVRLFVLAFALRVIAAFLLFHVFYLHNPGLLAPDEVGHDRSGMLTAAYLHGQGGSAPTFGYDTYVGLLYWIAPNFLLLPRIINAFGGALTAVFVALAAKNLFGREAGRAAGLVAALWPSAVLWSSLNLKDGWSILAMAVIAYEVTRLARHRLSAVAPGMLVATLVMAIARSWMLFVVVVGLAGGLVRSLPRGRVRAAGAIVAIVGGTALLISLGAGANYIGRLARVDIATVRATTAHGGSAFQGGINVHNPLQALRTAPAALATVLFAPFPWTVNGLRQALSLPETLAWYLMTPVWWRGIRRGLREVPDITWPLLGAAGALLVAIATLEGNLGLIYRHRLTAFVVLFVFFGAGWAEARQPQPLSAP